MEITELLTAKFAFVVLFSAGIAIVINWIDPPTTKLTGMQNWFASIMATILAAFVVSWNALESGSDIYGFSGFAAIVVGALGGIVTVRAIFNAPKAFVVPPSAPGPPSP